MVVKVKNNRELIFVEGQTKRPNGQASNVREKTTMLISLLLKMK